MSCREIQSELPEVRDEVRNMIEILALRARTLRTAYEV